MEAFVKKRWADCKRTECSDNQELSYNAFFGDNADENDLVFAKLMYVCRYMIKSIGICFACDRNGNPFEIRCESDILNYFSALYLNTESSFVADTNDFQHYSIFADREEVDLL